MAKITVECLPAVGLLADIGVIGEGRDDLAVVGHIYIVYTDDLGNEFVVRGGPSGPTGPFNLGLRTIVTEVGVPIAQSVDARFDPRSGQSLTPADRGSKELDLGGRRAEDVWNLILQQATNLNNSGITYNISTRNSNSVAAEILATVDINLAQNLPTPVFQTLGDPFLGVSSSSFNWNYRIDGTADNDRISGRSGNQTFTGAGGNDVLSGAAGDDNLSGGDDQDSLLGGAGNDVLSGGNGNDWLDGGAGSDTLNGGDGNDTLLASAGTDRLSGGAQTDVFRFDVLPGFGAAVADHITDFLAAAGDSIEVKRSAFGIAAGASVSLIAVNSTIGLNTALRTNILFVYDTRSGHLYWNQNSTANGVGSGGLFAVLDPLAGIAPSLGVESISLI